MKQHASHRERVIVGQTNNILESQTLQVQKRERFNPFLDVSQDEWLQLTRQFTHGISAWKSNNTAGAMEGVSLTPLVISLFAPVEIKEAFFTKEIKQHMDGLLHWMQYQENREFFLRQLPLLAANVQYTHPKHASEIHYSLVANSVLEEAKKNTFLSSNSALGIFFLTMLFPAEKNAIISQTTNNIEAMIGFMADRENRDFNIGSTEIESLAVAKLLNIQPNTVKRIVDSEAQRIKDYWENLQGEDPIDPNEFSTSIFSLAVLAAEKIDIQPDNIRFTFPLERQQENTQKIPPARRVRHV